jgi:hypothetical protein
MQMTAGERATPAHKSGLKVASARVLAMLLLFCTAAVYESVHLSSLTHPGVWQHLSTGLWILQNHAVPHTGLFSQSAQLPWMATSWGFDGLLAAGYKLAGLRVLPLALMAFEVVLAVSAFLLARILGRNFPLAVLLALAAQFALPPLQPLPNRCSIVCFAIELLLLFVSRRTGNVRLLYWLPLLFVFWVNLHIEFVYGLIVLGLWGAASLAEDLSRRAGIRGCDSGLPVISLGTVAGMIAACLASTLLSPYSYHVYEVVLNNARPAAYVAAEHAMNFRHPQHYVLLLLAMAAYLALGRRRSRDPFPIALMVAASALAFRIQGDGGFLVMASLAVIANASCAAEEIPALPRPGLGNVEALATGALLAAVIGMAALRIPSSQPALLNRIGESLPVRACAYIQQNRLPNPLFNDYRWGNFLTFFLPDYPVAIDDRTDLYGDARIVRYFKATNGTAPLDSDPGFVNARTFLLPADSAVAQALATFPGFTVAYRDRLAVVLVRQR